MTDDTFATARNLGALTTTQTYSDFVGTSALVDYSRFEVNTNSNFNLTINGNQYFGLEFYRDANNNGIIDSGETLVSASPNGSSISNGIGISTSTSNQTINGVTTINRKITLSGLLTPGVYYFKVYSSGSNINYNVNLGTTSSPDDPDGSGIYGTDGNDTLYGTSGIDNIYGRAGDDVIYGYGGVNTLFGEEGNDILNGGSGIDNLSGGSGNDTLNGYSGINNLSGGSGNDILNGGSDIDNLSGGLGNDLLSAGGGNDNLNGGLGNDTLNGGLGNDSLDGGVGDYDVAVFDGTSTNYTINMNGTIGTVTGIDGTDTLTDIEALQFSDRIIQLVPPPILNVINGTSLNDLINGTANADKIDGFDGKDQLYGLAGNDELYGGIGDDILNGGTGTDTLVGGSGNDTYYVDSVGDTIVENASEGTDKVSSSNSYILANNVENLTLIGTLAINGTGNALNNSITGNSGNNVLTGNEGNDILNGGLGADTLIGGVGNDTYVIDNVGDLVTELTAEGTDTVQSYITWSLGANFENLTLLGSAAINGTGNILNNTLTGNTANNILTGNEGNDILNGGLGADTLIGGVGNDTYVIDNVGDLVTELTAEGTDTVQSYITWSLGANFENLTLLGSAAINGTGNILNNTLTGNTANNILTGNEGNDILNGGLGADTLIGGVGNDTIYLGADTVIDSILYNSGDGIDTVNQFNRTVGDKIGFTGITDIDVVVSGTATSFHVGDGISGNIGFGTGAVLVNLNATTGFTAANIASNLAAINTANFWFI